MSISSSEGPGPAWELPLLLLAGFRSVIDEAHADLALRGHPDLRPAHGFAMQAIGTFGATAADVGRRLGVSKQAAGKTIERLAELGYVQRGGEAGCTGRGGRSARRGAGCPRAWRCWTPGAGRR